jgi:hypothetical protein
VCDGHKITTPKDYFQIAKNKKQRINPLFLFS